jgi:hypothetical protein
MHQLMLFQINIFISYLNINIEAHNIIFILHFNHAARITYS